MVHVGISQHNARALPAQLQGDSLEVGITSCLPDQVAHLGGASEGNC